MFDFLTLSVVIDDSIFCVHGGTSSFITSHCITTHDLVQDYLLPSTPSTKLRLSTASEVRSSFLWYDSR